MNFDEILKNNEFVGIVEDNNDPDRKQRVRIRVPYLHGTKEQIPTEHLPWAHCENKSINGNSFSIPEINKIINVVFPTGELVYPVYKYSQHLDINLQKKLESLNDKEYNKFHSILYNYNTQIFIGKELNITHNKSGLIIDDFGNVTTRLNGNSSKYYIGDENANQPLLLTTNFFKWFDQFIQQLSKPYLDSEGVEVVPTPEMLQILTQFGILKQNFTSNNVFVSDNLEISKNNITVEQSIGDNYEMIKSDPKLKIQIEEIKENIKKEEEIKENVKEEISQVIIDEKFNESDGLTAPGAEEDLKIFVDELNNKDLSTINLDIDSFEYIDGFYGYSDFEDFNNEDTYIQNNIDETINNINTNINDETINNNEIITYNGVVNGKYKSKEQQKLIREPLDFSILEKNENGELMISKLVKYNRSIYSQTAIDNKYENIPYNNWVLNNMKKIFSIYFDPVYKFFKETLGYTVLLHSSFRTVEVDMKLTGKKSIDDVKFSQHQSGSALDLVLSKNGKNDKTQRVNEILFYYLKHKFFKHKIFEFGQLIWEGSINNGDPQWIHISLNNYTRSGDIRALEGGKIKPPSVETVKFLRKHKIWNDSLENNKFIKIGLDFV